MPKLPGVNHLRAVKALQKAGFQIDRQSKHIFLSKGRAGTPLPAEESTSHSRRAAGRGLPALPSMTEASPIQALALV